MSVSECAKIALRNLNVGKKMSIKIIIGLSAVIMLLFSMCIYQKTFDNQVREISVEHKNDCYLYETAEVNSVKQYQKQKKGILENKKSWNVDEVCGFLPVSIYEEEDSFQNNREAIKNARLVIAGKEYAGKKEWLSDIQSTNKLYETDTVRVSFYDKDFSLFSNNVIEQYREQTGKENYLIGKMPDKEGEVIISDYLLGKFGIKQEEQKQYIGKKISLYVGKKGKDSYFEDYILTGIFDADMIGVREENSMVKYMEHIAVNFKEKDCSNLIVPCGGEFRYYREDFQQLTDTYLLTQQKKAQVEMSVYGSLYSVFERQISVINKILEYIMLGFVVAVTVYITSIIYFFFQRNRVYFVMLRAIGIRRKCIYQITIFEILYLILSAMVIGICFGLLALLGLRRVYEYAIGFDFRFTLPLIGIATLAAFGYCFVVFLIEGMFHCKGIIRENIPEVLKTELGMRGD